MIDDIPTPMTPAAPAPAAADADEPAPEIEIADPEVPLAAVPHTGDESAVWSLMALLSVAGMICVMAIERKKREEN